MNTSRDLTIYHTAEEVQSLLLIKERYAADWNLYKIIPKYSVFINLLNRWVVRTKLWTSSSWDPYQNMLFAFPDSSLTEAQKTKLNSLGEDDFGALMATHLVASMARDYQKIISGTMKYSADGLVNIDGKNVTSKSNGIQRTITGDYYKDMKLILIEITGPLVSI
jgi:hypothetical protein